MHVFTFPRFSHFSEISNRQTHKTTVFPSEGQNAIYIFLNIHLNRSCKYLLQSNSNLTAVKLDMIGLITNHHNS
jgi:hypothetical protein